jgi:hypothetical protein
MVIELKITNLNDWAIIQPLLNRLKIAFVQKDIVQAPVAEESFYLYKKPKRRAGFSKAHFEMSDDFNAPLEDFKEYML